MTSSLLIVLALIGVGHAASVEMDGATWRALHPADPVPAEAPAPIVADRDVTIVPVEGGLIVTARWTLRTAEPAWFKGVLIDAAAHVGTVTWDGAPATTQTTDDGVAITGFVRDAVEIRLDAWVPAEQVNLMPAVRGTVRLDGSALSADGALALSDGTAFLTGAASLSPADAPVVADAGDLVVAHSGLGVTVGDADVTLRARVEWVVRRGRLDAVALNVSGIGDDLEIEGPNVASWTRSGDRVDVVLREPALDRVDLSLSGSVLTPAGTEASLSLPRIEPLGAFRTEATVQIAVEEGLEIGPAMAGWQPVPSSALPDWGRDLVVAAPTAAFRAGGVPGGSLSLLRYEPVPLPPLVVDVADHRIATTRDGRVLARALYEIRNERAPWLRIVPPEGWSIIGIRVSGDTARPVTDGGPGWLVPLPRSVDTVSGLLSFPVEVAFLGAGSPWADEEESVLALPSVDAEVADWRATLFLPPGYRDRSEPGKAHVVEDFASGEGIVYGVSVGGAKVAEADAMFEDAVGYWLDNDFEKAQEKIDELRAMGAEGENVDKLQSNLDLVGGKYDVEEEDYAAKQIRSQARARAAEEEVEMKELERKAEERQKAGDYAGSTRYYEQALEIGENLQQIEGDEAVDIVAANEAYRKDIADNTKDMEQRGEVLGEAATTLPWDVEGDVAWDTESDLGWEVDGDPAWVPPPPETPADSPAGSPVIDYEETTEVEFESITVTGELLRIPTGRSYQGTVQKSPGRDRTRVTQNAPDVATGAEYARRGGGLGFKKKPAADSYGAGYGASGVGGIGTYGHYEPLAGPVVHASALSITVPEVGETVRFQRRLVPPDEAPALDIDAKITVRERRNS